MRINYLIIRPSHAFDNFIFQTINRPTMVPYCFVNAAFDQSQIKLLSSGTQLRNFVVATDLAERALAVLAEENNLTINIGSTVSMSIYDMACLVAETFRNVTQRDCSVLRPDVSIEGANLPAPLSYQSLFGGIVNTPSYAERIRATLSSMMEAKMKRGK